MTKLETDPCEICGEDAESLFSGSSEIIFQRCPKCGDIKFTRSAASMMRSRRRNPDSVRRVLGFIRDQNRSGAVPTINSDMLETIIARPLPSVLERAERLLLEALHGQNRLGTKICYIDPKFAAATYSLDVEEVKFLLELLEEQELMIGLNNSQDARVLPGGYARVDELLRGPNASSDKGFVAMWFHPSLEEAHTEGLQSGIMNAGYESVRVDQVEHVGRIDDEIIANINASRFVVADFTGHRGGVYFEAGYAMGKGMPVFWTCRKDDLDKLHFDIRQYNCIDWEDTDELAQRLTNRIEAVLGKGPHKV